jgi:hypothetical protein
LEPYLRRKDLLCGRGRNESNPENQLLVVQQGLKQFIFFTLNHRDFSHKHFANMKTKSAATFAFPTILFRQTTTREQIHFPEARAKWRHH